MNITEEMGVQFKHMTPAQKREYHRRCCDRTEKWKQLQRAHEIRLRGEAVIKALHVRLQHLIHQRAEATPPAQFFEACNPRVQAVAAALYATMSADGCFLFADFEAARARCRKLRLSSFWKAIRELIDAGFLYPDAHYLSDEAGLIDLQNEFQPFLEGREGAPRWSDTQLLQWADEKLDLCLNSRFFMAFNLT